MILSEYSDFTFVQNALKLGVQDYILKPITHQSLQELSEKIRQAMGDLEKKRYFMSLSVNNDGIEKLIREMQESGDPANCAEAFEYMVLHQINVADLKHFGMTFLSTMYDRLAISSTQKPALEEIKKKSLATYEELKNINEVIAHVKSQCYTCMSLCTHHAPQGIHYAQQIAEYIERHYGEPDLSVASVSEWLHLSPVYTGTLYKQDRGESIITSIHQVRMRHARQLLCESGLSVTSISRQVGYTTPDYFSRLFNSYFGMTPTQYRTLQAINENKKE